VDDAPDIGVFSMDVIDSGKHAQCGLTDNAAVKCGMGRMEQNDVLFTIRNSGTKVVITMKTVNEEGNVVLHSGAPAEQVIEAFKVKFPHANVMVRNLGVQ
jgi:uncharacterized protein YhbP (UPF0306 family)